MPREAKRERNIQTNCLTYSANTRLLEGSLSLLQWNIPRFLGVGTIKSTHNERRHNVSGSGNSDLPLFLLVTLTNLGCIIKREDSIMKLRE